MTGLGLKAKLYTSGLTDEEWTRTGWLTPKPSRPGRSPAVDLLPLHDQPVPGRSPGGSAASSTACRPAGSHDTALTPGREAAGREARLVLDSQTVKAPFVEMCGYEAASRSSGCKGVGQIVRHSRA